MSAKIAVVYYSSTGNVHQLAKAVAEGAESEGAEVRLRHVAEIAPDEAIESNEAWKAHRQEVEGDPEASMDDLDWADGYAFGSPTRFGNVTAQLKQFIDQAGPLWSDGKLADKVATSFTSAQNAHGGQESTILSLNNVFYHWGSLIVPPGYTDERLLASGGNPYGTSWTSGGDADEPTEAVLDSARYQGARLARFAAKLAG